MIYGTIFTVALIVGGVTLLKHFIQNCGKNDNTNYLIENNDNNNNEDIPPSYNEINNNNANNESPPSY